MDSTGNPFGVPPPQPVNPLTAGNPFGAPIGEVSQQQQQQQQNNESVSGYSSTYSNTQPNPFAAPPPAQPNSYGLPTQTQYISGYPAPPQNPQGYPAPPQSNNPFGTPSVQSSAVVVAPNQSNPYTLAPSFQYGQQHQLQIVPTNQQVQPWSMPQQNQQLVPSAAGFDPFAQPPPPAPEPASHDIDLFLQPQQQGVNPYQQPPTNQPEMEPYIVQSEEPPPAVPANGHQHEPPSQRSERDNTSNEIKEAPDVAAAPEGTMYPPQIQYGHRPDVQPDPEPTGTSPRNPYAPTLAREAPPGASPLPKAELVRKRGFALSRISFRTIVMKKWKQTYWVQYGPHTMLWFRSQADFDDWLNNPYHMQTERNFLIKLAVNFVHDLYKPNVRGYQVTQCRTKGYGNKIVRQFKLERWMDYGPTIAAAFGSYDPVEVDTLREAIVECMRNTPLEGGIRATGAVRQPNPQQNRDRDDDDDDDDEEGDDRNQAATIPTNEVQKEANSKEPEISVSEEADLLDVNNWDDVPLEPQQHLSSNPLEQNSYASANTPQQVPNGQPPYGIAPQQQHAPVNAGQPYGGHDPNLYAMQTQQYPPPQPAYSTALVPAANPSQSYPGAPSQPPQQQQWGLPPQQHHFQQHGFPQPPQVNHPQQQQGYPQPPPQVNYPQQQVPPHPQQPAYQQQPDTWANPQPTTHMQPPQY